jgi:steroid Delta-isomerase
MTHQAALAEFIHFCEHLSRDNTGGFAGLYSADAFFKDPFNEVRGHAAIIKIFEHMFVKVDTPRFVVTCSMLQGDEAFLVWEFLFYFKGDKTAEQRIHGSTHLRFSPGHKVEYHRDYWDAAEELYEKIPLLGRVMRFIKSRANK